MLFSVIYSADYDANGGTVYVDRCRPPAAQLDADLWQETESNESELIQGWAHNKWCAVLTRQQFEEFIEHVMAHASTTQTMGSIGAPGFGFGHAPAICFDGSTESCDCTAYVTPIPHHIARHMFEGAEGELFSSPPLWLRPIDTVKATPMDEKRWEKVRDAVVEFYGDGVPRNSRFQLEAV